jgi:hypothetical protein
MHYKQRGKYSNLLIIIYYLLSYRFALHAMQMADYQRLVLHFGSANPLNATMLQK